ncbi:fibroblast growth factor 1-like [Anoplophora glabripennis]|uniref:fibroblast growth factor 1-like n=1 Tax=Anoplophora glabripennis TaxID=217634 RepID=UPI000873C83F|nr:fibroblast growth factor 1-like [Anoplophora glabripennis]
MKNEESAVGESSSDDDTVSEDEQDNFTHTTRVKRYTEWCGVDTENHSFYETTKRVVWPPPSSSSSSAQSYINLRPTRVGNPVLGNKMQLYSKTGHHLAIYPDGSVKGTSDENDLHTYLEVVSAGFPGHVKIKGMLTNLYVAMNKKGMLYGEPNSSEEATVFIESFQGSYNAYLSRKYAHLGWYIGIKKSGKVKKGPKTAYGQKAVRFIPRRSKFE